MKILQIHTSLANGGIESFIVDLSNQLINFSSVTVCLLFDSNESLENIKRLDKRIKVFSLNKKKGVSINILFKIYKILKAKEYDVVQMHGFFYYYILSVLLIRKKVSFFYTIHSDAIKENSKWDKRLFMIKRYCFSKDFLTPITISNESQNSYNYIYKRENSELIYNGVSEIEYIGSGIKNMLKPESTYFLHAGRITSAKNQLMLCEVFNKITSQRKDIFLLIAGGVQDQEIFNKLREYLSENIIYLGDRHDVRQILFEVDAMCLSSFYEGLPMILLEAFNASCIPICTPVGGIVNVIIDKSNGILSDDISEESYTNAILYFLHLTDSQKRDLKINARKSLELFNIKNTAIKYFELYEQKQACKK